jgi:cupin 2 domain-containing protein
MEVGNLFSGIPAPGGNEWLQVLLQTSGCQVERIVSRGHTTPPGQWYDQETDEWVVLLSGAARLRLEEKELEMKPGDWVFLPARLRHRVEWTDPQVDSVWLAIHLKGGVAQTNGG